MDPQEYRSAGHQVVDLLADYLSGIEHRPLFPNVEPRALYELFDEPLPQDPEPPGQVLDEVTTKLFPNSTHVGHPEMPYVRTASTPPIGRLSNSRSPEAIASLGYAAFRL